MRIRLSTVLHAPPEWVAEQLRSTATFRHVTAPLLRFHPVQGAPWPIHWAPGALTLQMRLLGVLPLGRQTVRIAIEPPAEPGGWPTLCDHGDGTLMRRWEHRITLQALPGGRTLYTDDVAIQARYAPRWVTPLSVVFVQVFFRHRQRRWRQWVERHAMAEAPVRTTLAAAHRRAAFDHLMAGFARAVDTPAAARWHWLEAAHVLGQASLPLHWRSHTAMLRYALALRDARETAGQLLRLAMVPAGHLLGRLPRGNIGRAHVPALRHMAPPAEVAALIEQALICTQVLQD